MNDQMTAYWLQYYVADHCTLCGNHGIIDSRGLCTPAGIDVGRLNYCICPNGQAMRDQGVDMLAYATEHMPHVVVLRSGAQS